MVSVIIVTYNSESVIENCLNSLSKSIKRPKSQIILVDNGSKDETVKLVEKLYPQTIIIKNKKNLGFAKAVNIGLKRVREDALLLNPDTTINKDLLTTLWDVSKKRGTAGVAPKILNFNGSLQPSCGNFPTALNILVDRIPLIRNLFPISEIIRKGAFYEKKRVADWSSGTCLYLTKKALDTVGGFDEDYFMYLEEVDWCYRARAKNLKIIYTPKVSIYHKDQGKSPTYSPAKFFNMRRGFITFFEKYDKPVDLFLFKILLKVELFFKMIFVPKNSLWTKIYKKTNNL
ncbi:MAG: glycosyl transferase family 2 [Candidatus Woesebacteria bacterium GW2011_GWB1_38_5b]|uniref:Glycosyl transferase family 2 n=1 Tax=Candidatus Woesebacteria bacterium GW2011_GWB1_38_5b TaxID=1618569 RepID=A0A0G0NAZ0_9BACT|nr:MAG: glycosyl transferase family 2 [Candidatus Woesebacteria bacterium GW2011_GWB1_38_5b]